MKIRQDATGQELDIPDDAVGDFVAKGGYSFPEGTQVPIRHNDGSVSTVPVQQFWQNRALYAPASQNDIQAHIAKQQKLALDQEEALKEAKYGDGIANTLQAGAEATARGLTLGASDWVAKQMGADVVGMQERQKRHQVAAFVGEAIGFVAPALLTGGTSALAEGGLKAAIEVGAKAAPSHIVSAIGDAVGERVAAQLGEGFLSRVAAGTAKTAAEGAIMGVGGEISAKSLDNKDLLSDGELGEYLQAAGYGALAGGIMGGGFTIAGGGLTALSKASSKAWEGTKGMLGKAADNIQAPIREAEADVVAAKTAIYDGEVRALEQKYDGLKPEDLSKLKGEHAAAKAKLEAVAPRNSIISPDALERMRSGGPDYVYHSTPFDNASGIAQNGLESRNGGIFFANTPEQAMEWNYRTGGKQSVALRAAKSDIADLETHPDRPDWNLAQQTISPDRMQYFDPVKKAWRPLQEFDAASAGFRDKWGDVIDFSPSKQAFQKAGGRSVSAHADLEAVTNMVAADAERLGVPKQDVRSAMDRVKASHEAFSTLDAEHDATTRRIAEHLDAYNENVGKADELVDFKERMAAVGKEMATDRTAPPAEMMTQAMREQHAKMLDTVWSFKSDPDGRVASAAQTLGKILRKNDNDLVAIAKREFLSKKDAIEAYRLVDHSQRVIGRIRDRIGERTSLGSTGLSEALEQSYEDTRQFLKNPNIVGEKTAQLVDQTKGDWSEKFTVGRGASILSSSDMGGNRVASGFDTYRRGDPAKIGAFLKNSGNAEGQLALELVGRNFDADARRLTTYAKSLNPSPEARAAIEKALAAKRAIADEIVAYRSKDALAREFAASVAPAMKEFEALDSKLVNAQERAQTKLAEQQAKLQERIDAAKVKAGEARDKAVQKAEERLQKAHDDFRGGIAGGVLEGAMVTAGMLAGGPAGAIFGYHAVHAAQRLAGPIMKAVAKNALHAAINTGEAMGKYRAALTLGKKVETAIGTLGDAMRVANPARTAGKIFAFQKGRDVNADFEQAKQKVTEAQDRDQRAAYLMTLLPQDPPRQMLRSDLDKIPKIDILSKRSFLRSYKGVMDPVGTIHRAGHGAASAEEINALRNAYPQIHARVVQGVLRHAAKLTEKPSMTAQVNMGKLIGQPVHFTQQPDFVAFAQGAYRGAASQGQSGTDMASSSSSQHRAREVSAKGASAMATPSQRLEGGVGSA